ncbi:MAG: DUF4371 domain-containing protein [Sedimenticola sp.]
MNKDSVACAPCFLFAGSGSGRDKAFATKPIDDWSNLGRLINHHQNSKQHTSSMVASENVLLIAKGEKKDIKCSISTAYSDLITKNRAVLAAIVETIILCGRQNIALRGHNETDSNFIAILHDKARNHDVLDDHLKHGDPRTKYTSPMIQNELIEICGNMVKADIINACVTNKFFGFIADEATDVSTIEQMALCIRYFDGDKSELREDFIGFAECESTTGEQLAAAFIENLQKAGIDIQNMRGQGYDGAANMSGQHKGVKSRIQQLVPQALYTHCKAHSLNLAIVHASGNALVRSMFDTVQQIAFSFNYSAKRLHNFRNCLADNADAREELHSRTKLRSLCETRWSARSDSLATFKAAFTAVCDSLEDLEVNHNDHKARSYRNAITRFDFIVCLVAIEHILSAVAPLSLYLQRKDTDLIAASREAGAIVATLTTERGDETVWEALYEKATEIAAKVDVSPSRPRNPGRQQNRPNAPAEDPSTYWRVNMYFGFLDHLIQEMQTRLLDGRDRFEAEHLLPKNADKLTDVNIQQIFKEFQPDLLVDGDGFNMEARRWKSFWGQEVTATDEQKPSTVSETLAVMNRDLYPNIYICLSVFVCMPVSTATAERSFSTMRRVKTYLRATMTTHRLTGLALLNIYREHDLNVEHVIDEFARKKDRRLSLLFRV